LPALDHLLNLIGAAVARGAVGNLFQGIGTADGFDDFLFVGFLARGRPPAGFDAIIFDALGLGFLRLVFVAGIILAAGGAGARKRGKSLGLKSLGLKSLGLAWNSIFIGRLVDEGRRLAMRQGGIARFRRVLGSLER